MPVTPIRSPLGEETGARRPALIGHAALFAVAVLYFSFGWSLSMEWMDQGQLLYPSWRVAEGAVPLRDFAHMYGPSTFLLVGFLLRVLGSDVLVVRVALILLKAATAVIAYAYTRRIASRAAALAAFAVDVAILGTPWWIFNTPYPNHFALALNLAGFLALLAFAARPLTGSFLAGLCFGLSATFKQTLGAFALIAAIWFALYEREADGGAARSERALFGVLGPLRLLVLLGSLLTFAGYVAKYPHAFTDAVLLGPVAAVVALLARRERRLPPSARDHARALRIAAGLAAGFALPLAACVGFYASIGALGALRFSTVTVPAAMDWFVPIAFPKARTLALLIAAVSAAVAAGSDGERARTSRRIAWAVCAAALGAFAASVLRAEGVRGYLRSEAWIGEVFSLVFWMPFVLCSAGLARIAFAGRGGGARHGESGAALMCFYGVAALLHLYPAADFWHLLNMLPVYTILLGRQLDRLQSARTAGGSKRFAGLAPVAVGGALAATLAVPFGYVLAKARMDRAPSDVAIPRASGILDSSPKFSQAAALVAFLREPQRAGRELAVIANEQMLYFVSGKRSVWDGQEFLLYLVGARLLRGDGARALLDEETLLERLASRRPLVVDYQGGEASKRLWETFPRLASHVAEHYRQVASFGGYVVLDQSGS